jgi:hypothetical protein
MALKLTQLLIEMREKRKGKLNPKQAYVALRGPGG